MTQPQSNPTATDRWLTRIATLGPAGLAPFAPGTWGSLAAGMLAPFLFLPLPPTLRVLALIAVLAGGTWAAGRAEVVLGRKDPGCIVIDELLGLWVTYLPFATLGTWGLTLGFLLFRLFDILKPWPIKRLERGFPGGFGVMIDDVMAGVYAAACLVIVLRLL